MNSNIISTAVDIFKCKEAYSGFIDSCFVKDKGYRLTPNSEITPYALCFAIFGKHLIKREDELSAHKEMFDKLLRENIDNFKQDCLASGVDIFVNKNYLQLLCFTLSALSILDALIEDPLEDHVVPLLSQNIKLLLVESGVFDGKPGTGNLAMFYAVLMLHSKRYLNNHYDDDFEWWVSEHVKRINSYGFWGEAKNMSYLQFQNGYHQYEIFEYIAMDLPSLDKTINNVASLADNLGHFAPYPGGGGCYDYDAVFIMTLGAGVLSEENATLLDNTMNSILNEQNKDGGFSESRYIRPFSFKSISSLIRHVLRFKDDARIERLKYCLTILRPKHNRIKTHWTEYSRGWGESDLWDSWFRMLTIARVQLRLYREDIDGWGFIDFPGIGYHHLLKYKK